MGHSAQGEAITQNYVWSNQHYSAHLGALWQLPGAEGAVNKVVIMSSGSRMCLADQCGATEGSEY